MRIKSVTATPVNVPVTRVGAFSRTKRTHVSRTIVEIETDGGLTGLGETRGEWSAAIISETFAARLFGLPALERHTARQACLPLRFDYGFPEQAGERNAFAAVELALWDIAGKAVGQPLFRLLGGPARARAPFVAYAYAVDPAEGHKEAEVPDIMAGIAERAVAATGAVMFEFKVGLHPVACEIETVGAARAALGPDVDLAVDANMGFSVEQARRFLAGVEKARLANFEEPVEGLAETARLSADTGVPVSTHCTDLDALRAHPAIEAVVSDLHLHGGIDGVIALMNGVTGLGKRFWLRSAWELGISWAAMCHLGMARPELDHPAQQLMDWVADDLVLGEPWLVREGGVCPPETPGLGVELDRDAMARYATGRGEGRQ